MTEDPIRYPIGQFSKPEKITSSHILDWIEILERYPAQLQDLIAGLSDQQLNTPYREGGWTIRQLVHHLADSHLNSYIRFKWALTEDNPVIKFYYEDRWAELDDSLNAPVELSLAHLKATHDKLVFLLRSLNDEQLNRTFIHPEHNKEISLKENIGVYAWHSQHHYKHIRNLMKRKHWLS